MRQLLRDIQADELFHDEKLHHMGLLRILTNTLCTLGARPQLPHVTAGHGAWRSVPHQAPARRVHGTPPLPPPHFSSSDGIWHRQIELALSWCTTARHGIECDTRRPCQSPRVQPGTMQGASYSRVYIHVLIWMSV